MVSSHPLLLVGLSSRALLCASVSISSCARRDGIGWWPPWPMISSRVDPCPCVCVCVVCVVFHETVAAGCRCDDLMMDVSAFGCWMRDRTRGL